MSDGRWDGGERGERKKSTPKYPSFFRMKPV